jgi:hypothetical protein
MAPPRTPRKISKTVSGMARDQADDHARDDRVLRGVEELVVAPAAIDDLRGDGDEHEGSQEVGDLVVAGDGFEQVPQKASRVQHGTENDQRYDPSARHPLRPPVSAHSDLHPAYIPGSPYWNTPSGTS